MPQAEIQTGEDILAPEFVRGLERSIEAGERRDLRKLVRSLHASDLADLIELLRPDQRRALVKLLGTSLDPALLTELEGGVREEILESLDPAFVARAVERLDSDDALAVVETLEPEEQERVLARVTPSEREEIERGLDYPASSAGRLMQRSLVAAPAAWDVGTLIDHLRKSRDLPRDFQEIYVVDPAFRLRGTLPVSRAMRTPRAVKLRSLMDRGGLHIPARMDQEEAARLFRKYNLVAAPVVGEDKRLLGMITADDIFEVIEQEATEDIKRLGGIGRGSLTDTITASARGRFGWLLVNLATAIIASIVIAFFDQAIERMVALAILMPIVASMGGVAGTQTLTLAVRALATHELVPANQRRIILHEAVVGVLNGLLFAAVLGMVGGVWFQSLALGLVLAAAVIVTMCAAALAGMLIPLALEKAGVDPAVASGVFVTTVTDIVGFFAFLGLAAWLLL